MTKPALIGTVNGFVYSRAWLGKTEFGFDGTMRGMVRSAHEAGAKPGDIVSANFGGTDMRNIRDYTLYAAPYDDRAFGLWAK
jgi:hypothetical protein